MTHLKGSAGPEAGVMVPCPVQRPARPRTETDGIASPRAGPLSSAAKPTKDAVIVPRYARTIAHSLFEAFSPSARRHPRWPEEPGRRKRPTCADFETGGTEAPRLCGGFDDSPSPPAPPPGELFFTNHH